MLDAYSITYPSRWVAGYSPASSWGDNDLHPRMVADVDGDGLGDIVGFGNGAACVSFATGSGFGRECEVVHAGEYGSAPIGGGWTSNTVYPRMMADVNGDGRADIVGFGSVGVYVSLWDPVQRQFSSCPDPWLLEFGTRILPSGSGGWEDSIRYPRMMADVNGDGKADIVGFANAGVVVALTRSDGTGFETAHLVLGEYGVLQGWVDNVQHPRMLMDVDGDDRTDIVGFGKRGVRVHLSTGSGFAYSAERSLSHFGSDGDVGGWEDNIRHPRLMAYVNNDRLPDIVGFGNAGVVLSLASAQGFGAPRLVLQQFGALPSADGWEEKPSSAARAGDPYNYVLTSGETRTGHKPKFLRTMGDMNGDGLDDIVGFGNAGMIVSYATGTGFTPYTAPATPEYGYLRQHYRCEQNANGCVGQQQVGWRSHEHPRVLATVRRNSPRAKAVIGFGYDGVLVTERVDMQPICSYVTSSLVNDLALREHLLGLLALGAPRNSCSQMPNCGAAATGTPCVDTNTLANVENWLVQRYQDWGYAVGGQQARVELEPVQQICKYMNNPSNPTVNPSDWNRNNVIVTKVGSVYPDVFIEVSAHIDSHPHSPGAVDNGSGSVAVMEMARLLQSTLTRHSIRFINYVGHEHLYAESGYCLPHGNQGSYTHVMNVLEAGKNGRPSTYASQTILASLNLDGIGWSELSPQSNNGPSMNAVLFAPHPEQIRRDNPNGALDLYAAPASSRIADLFSAVRSPCGIDIQWKKSTWGGGDANIYAGSDSNGNPIEEILRYGGIPSVASIGGVPFDFPVSFTNYHDCGDTFEKVNMVNVYRTTQQNLSVLLALDTLDNQP